VVGAGLSPPCHAPSDWLRLFFEPNLFPYKYPTFPTAVTLHTYLPMKMEQTECSETLEFKLQTSGNNPEEIIRHAKHGESFKPRSNHKCFMLIMLRKFYNAIKTLILYEGIV
jgi:hypothetical protein